MSNISQAVLARRQIRATNSAKRKELADQLRLEGNDMYKKKNYVEAANNYAKAVDIHGPKPLLMSNLAITYLKLELYEDAEWAATTALTYDPRNIKARFRRALARKGIALETMGQKGMDARQAAISDLQIIINEDPKCMDARTEMYGLLEADEDDDDDDVFSIDYEDYPGYHEEPKELISDSDTSECRHTGNGNPCRSYNRRGCARASECHNSHAPDDKSVRDELGRNVCLDFLIGECEVGKCPYSHDRTYLPSGGWWDDPGKTESRYMLKLVEAESKQTNLENLGKREKDMFLTRLKASFERAAQKAPDSEATSTSQTLAPEPLMKPFILLLSLENEDFFVEIHAHVLKALRDKLQVIQALTHQDALKHLSSPGLAGVFVTDPGIVKTKASAVVNKLVAYVKNGGSAVIAGLFSTFITPLDFNKFFKNAWGLDWTFGSYFRTTFSINPSNELAKRNPSLATSYSMKAVHIDHISPGMALYGDFTSSPLKESPAVCVRVGSGLLSYLGDVNAETSSTNTVLAMLGLLDASNELLPLSQPPTSLPGAEITSQFDGSDDPGPKMPKNTMKQTTKASVTQKPSMSSRRSNDAPTISTASQSTEEKFILIIVLKHQDTFMQVWKSQMSALREKRQVHIADTTASVLDHLASPDLDGVYVADEGVIYPQILSKLVEYTMCGGTVVVGGVIPSMAKASQVATLFSAFHLSWRRGTSFSQLKSDLIPDHDIARLHLSISKSYSHDAVTLNGVDRNAILYTPFSQVPDRLEAPIVQTRVGEGTLGYIGDTDPAPESTPILLAMLDLMNRPSTIVPDTLKFVMVLSFSLVDIIRKQYDDFFQKLGAKVEVLHGLSNARIIDLLSSPDLVGVFISDSSITDHENRYLLSKLVGYSESGGTIIFGAVFCGNMTLKDVRPFFLDNWGLPWEPADGHLNTTVSLNTTNSLVMTRKRSDFPVSFDPSAHYYLKGMTPSTAVYAEPSVREPNKPFQSAILYAGVQKGHIGYIGMEDLDESFTSIFCAMLGIP